MKHRLLSTTLALLAALPLLGGSTTAQRIRSELVASGINTPLWAGAPEGDPRIFIAQKNGLIRIVRAGVLLGVKLLDLRGKVSNGGEQGLLGVAFHPDFANNGFFYVSYTNLVGNTVISRFHVPAATPNSADPASETILISRAQPFTNHNGGWLGFGPDGFLYIAFGDGGSGGDPGCRAQDLSSLLGKILRIDVDNGSPYAIPPDNPFVGVAGARAEVWHYGLRNPWRVSFDRLTGDMFIGDVGQDAREEIDFAPAGVGGINFGWKIEEGSRCNSTAACGAGTPPCGSAIYQRPIFELLHSAASRPGSITGGHIYRGCAIPSLEGTYFFADYIDNIIRSFTLDTTSMKVSNFVNRTSELAPSAGSVGRIASFGEDGFGELLIVEHKSAGEVYKIVPDNAVAALNTIRNGSAVNAMCYSAISLPVLGGEWIGKVDTSAHPGATMVAVYGYQTPTSGAFVPGGEALVDLSSQQVFHLTALVSTPVLEFQASIPCDPTLAGFGVFTQATIFGGGWELCNAIDVQLGQF